MTRTVLYLLLLILFVVHQDFWFWDDPTLLFGFLPVGLAYHAAYCAIASLLWYLVVTRVWPHEAEIFADGGPQRGEAEPK
jgi:hypothetical protein